MSNGRNKERKEERDAGRGKTGKQGGGRQAGKKDSTIVLHKKECFHLNVEKLKV